MRIVFPNIETGGIRIIQPADDLDPSDVARKDVPAGLPFLIMADTDLPTDRGYRDAWEMDFNNPAPVITINPEKAAAIDDAMSKVATPRDITAEMDQLKAALAKKNVLTEADIASELAKE